MSAKLFVAGLSWTTTHEDLHSFFSQFGVVKEAIVIQTTEGQSKGFGFVTFQESAVIDLVLTQELELDGRKLSLKRALPTV